MFQLQRCNVSISGGYHRIPKNLLYSATQQQQPVAKHQQQQRHGHQGDGHQPKQSEYSTDSDTCVKITDISLPLLMVTNSYKSGYMQQLQNQSGATSTSISTGTW